MTFRKKYIEATGLNLNRTIHVHHIDGDRSNNTLLNLVHATTKKHLRYHRLISIPRMVIKTIDINEWAIEDLKESSWIRSFCLWYKPMDNWCNKLYSVENYLIKNLNKRNSILHIHIEESELKNTFISEKEREVIEIFKSLNNG